MLRYILLRLGYFFITILIVSVALFALSRLAPGDAIDNMLDSNEDLFGVQDYSTYLERRKETAKQYHLDLPPFYFSIAPIAVPKKLYTIPSRKKRNWFRKLIYKYKNADQAWLLIENFQKLELLSNQSESSKYINLKKEIAKIKYSQDILDMERFNKFLQLLSFKKDDAFLELQSEIGQNIMALKTGATNTSISQILIPKIIWHGTNNQYHNWFSNFVKGDFGLSTFDRRPVKTRIWAAIGWTLLINISSIFLAFIISIPLGVYSALPSRYLLDKLVSTLSMMLYALPVFWVATLAITFFASNDWFHWFPSGGLGRGNNGGIGRFFEIMYHLILPIICVTYVALAFIIRQVRGAMVDTLDKEFIKTAKAKGLEEKNIVWRHGFRNSLIPLITMFSAIFPATIAGSLVVEIIFSIPGMGRLAYDGILQQDWNVVFTIMLLGTCLTLIGNLIADLIYAKIDPRIVLTKESSTSV